MVDLFFIKTFVATAKTGSFRIAAERNHITQPAVSQHVKTLEKKLNAILFDRQRKKASLTPAGKIFLPYAENILKQYEEAKMRIHEIDNEFRGTIRIATIYSIGLYELQSTIKKFLRKYPKINLHLEYHNNATIYEMITNQTIDFGLVAFPKERFSIASEVFVEDKLIFVQPPSHPVSKRKSIPLENLTGIKFIAFSPTTPTGKTINELFTAKDIFPNVIQEYDNIELIKSAVVLGLGCAILPKNTIRRELKDGSLELVNITGLNLTRPLGILYPSGKTFTKSAHTFYDAITMKKKSLKERAMRI